MNITTFLVSIFVLLLILWGLLKAHSFIKKSNIEDGVDEEYKKYTALVLRLLIVIFVLLLISLIQSSGIVRIPDPFQGQKVSDELQEFDSSKNDSTNTPPKLKSVPLQPDFSAVQEDHKKQLREFEKR